MSTLPTVCGLLQPTIIMTVRALPVTKMFVLLLPALAIARAAVTAPDPQDPPFDLSRVRFSGVFSGTYHALCVASLLRACAVACDSCVQRCVPHVGSVYSAECCCWQRWVLRVRSVHSAA